MLNLKIREMETKIQRSSDEKSMVYQCSMKFEKIKCTTIR